MDRPKNDTFAISRTHQNCRNSTYLYRIHRWLAKGGTFPVGKQSAPKDFGQLTGEFEVGSEVTVEHNSSSLTRKNRTVKLNFDSNFVVELSILNGLFLMYIKTLPSCIYLTHLT